MKKFLCCLPLVALLALPAAAQNYILYNGQGQQTGSVRPDAFNPDRTNSFNGQGQKTGYQQTDSFDPAKTNFYNSQGQKTGEVRRSPW